MKFRITVPVLLMIIFSHPLLFASEGSDFPSDQWNFSVYHGEYAASRLGELAAGETPNYIDEYLTVIALAKRVYNWNDNLHFELEGQLGRGSRDPHHNEYNIALAARWTSFPWNDYLPTSCAIGEGLSYASEYPPDERNKEDRSRLLNYLYFELEIVPPLASKFSIFGRVHHRSGIGGLFDDVHGGSNMLALGLRYKL